MAFFYILIFVSPPNECVECSGQQINLTVIYTLVALCSQCVSPRLVLSYGKEEAGKPDFCDGHSPSVTITFVCPSERREVSACRKRTSQRCMLLHP